MKTEKFGRSHKGCVHKARAIIMNRSEQISSKIRWGIASYALKAEVCEPIVIHEGDSVVAVIRQIGRVARG